MAKGTPRTEQFQHFVSNIRESFWGDVYGTTRLAWKKLWEADSARQRDRQARVAFRQFQLRWQREYPSLVRKFAKDLPNLLSFFSFSPHLWNQLRTTNIIERCFVEVRRRTRPMVCFVNVHSVDRIIFSIFSRFNGDWKNRTLRVFTQAA